jgi:hypothetical protein
MVAGLLKVYSGELQAFVTFLLDSVQLYLRQLPEPLFRFPLQERILHSEARGKFSPTSLDNSNKWRSLKTNICEMSILF